VISGGGGFSFENGLDADLSYGSADAGLFSSTLDWPGFATIPCSGALDQMCNFNTFIPAANSFAPFTWSQSSFGTVDGVEANSLMGYMEFSGSVFIEPGQDDYSSIPIAVSGSVIGFEDTLDLNGILVSSIEEWTVDFTGTGTLSAWGGVPGSFSGGIGSFDSADSVSLAVPEPRTWGLVGVGLMWILIVFGLSRPSMRNQYVKHSVIITCECPLADAPGSVTEPRP